MPEAVTVGTVDSGAVEEVARAYLRASRGDAQAALAAVVRDGLAEVERTERRLTEMLRFISRGYARGALHG